MSRQPEEREPPWPELQAAIFRLRTDLLRAARIYNRGRTAYGLKGDDLHKAADKYNQKCNGGREGAIEALAAVAAFIESVPEIKQLGAVTPLVQLGLALADLDSGSVHPMLAPLSPNKRDSRDRRFIVALSVFTTYNLIKIGEPSNSARKAVADLLEAHHVRGRAGKPVSAGSIRDWENRTRPSDDGWRSPEGEDFRQFCADFAPELEAMQNGIKAGTVTQRQMRNDLLARFHRALESLRDRNPTPAP